MRSLYDFLTNTDPETEVCVYDSHSHVLIFRDILSMWLYEDVLSGKDWEVRGWEYNQTRDKVKVYVSPIKKEKVER